MSRSHTPIFIIYLIYLAAMAMATALLVFWVLVVQRFTPEINQLLANLLGVEWSHFHWFIQSTGAALCFLVIVALTYLLAMLSRTPHAITVPRDGGPGYPVTRLVRPSWTRPIAVICNQNSFSNAEIISHAFKTLGRGTLVGQETYGAVISTGGTRLIDGTFVRLPFRGRYLLDGTDMENNGAVPDIIVPQTPQDESSGEDAQLRAAVEDLLGRL